MKQWVFAAIVLATVATNCSGAWEGDLIPGDLHGALIAAYDSKYIWRGFDVFNDEGVFHYGADLDFFQTGFGGSVLVHRATSSGFEDWERMDLSAYYQGSAFPGEPYAVNYRMAWVYYDYPDSSSYWFNLQEGHAIVSLPNVLPLRGLVPTYMIVKMWPSESNAFVETRSAAGTASGWLHVVMLDYTFPIPGFVPQIPEHRIKLHAEMVYNDGVSPWGLPVDHDWSHAVFGISTDLDLGRNFTLTPALYHQLTMEDSVNPDENETWVSVSLKFAF